MSDYGMIADRINQLRYVVSFVNISKDSLQLDIMMALSQKEMSAADIAQAVGQRRKAVTDSLRKLKNKELIESISGNGSYPTYKLTSTGLENISSLIRFIEEKESQTPLIESPTLTQPTALDPGAFSMASVTAQLLLALGTSKGNRLAIKKLAGVVGLSTQRTESYLDVYLNRGQSSLGATWTSPAQ
ncbi:MAG: helix-turn-helix domain-containing protein [Candidatus Methanomethylicus sp.]|nr:helix-turn-helix domain-containing protein [Candidatus Methanomethylicus sp.]